ncbi:flp pilus-assembly TadE/G-like family protein [Nocardioides zeae]|uniref:Flp pilus-assembly TadE/G-like family protein n=1 Tax=Nocardioides imazamoxiresistens TaxID=3231893 RepID=A0ABU3Q045_9ACTN|nr:Rv3654c family TadE-like protein [Nocardioides zeae]MDT9594764.1 flp pilus-assembly TadE/G-like family protein [Nocardioides zeae]
MSARDQRGAATLAALGLLGVLVLVALGAATGTAVFADHRRAEAAADLAALAGASAVGAGEDACAGAREVAAANGARLVGCDLLGADVLVRVEVRRTYLAGLGAAPDAQARAGPAGVASP